MTLPVRIGRLEQAARAATPRVAEEDPLWTIARELERFAEPIDETAPDVAAAYLGWVLDRLGVPNEPHASLAQRMEQGLGMAPGELRRTILARIERDEGRA